MVAYSSEHDYSRQHKNEKKDCILLVTALSVILQKKKIKKHFSQNYGQKERKKI